MSGQGINEVGGLFKPMRLNRFGESVKISFNLQKDKKKPLADRNTTEKKQVIKKKSKVLLNDNMVIIE